MPSSSRHLLTAALDKLDHYKADARSLESAIALLRAQLSDALERASTAHQQLAVSHLRLEHAQQALATSNADLRQAKLDASASRQEADSLRTQFYHLREQIHVRDAREQARQQGYDQGLQQAHQSCDQGLQKAYDQGLHTPPDIHPSPQLLKASFDSALSLARQDNELRFQREFEHQLNAERQRLQRLTLQHQHDFERASKDQSDQFQKIIQDTQKHTNEIRSRLEEELKKEQQAVELMRHERDQERLQRQAEEAAVELVTQERDQERLKRQAEEMAREKDREERELERQQFASERAALIQERDSILARARSPSTTTSNDHEPNLTAAPVPYIPMPRPPIDMPIPPLPIPEPPHPSSRSTQPPALPVILPARHGTRRSSIESQSSTSTVAGAFDSLVSFPHAVPSVPRASRREGPYGNPERDLLSDIPEDASDRSALSPSERILVPPPPVLNWSADPTLAEKGQSVIPTIAAPDNNRPLLNPPKPDNASNSSYEIVIEPPSTPTISPREDPDPESPVQPVISDQYLSPAHATRPIPPIQPRSYDDQHPLTQDLPPGFIPQTFTPHTVPIVDEEDLPPGFVPQSITDTTTGITTPFMSNAALDKHGDDPVPKKNLVLYGNPNTGRGDDDGRTKWSSTGWDLPPSTLTGPPVIPSWNHDDDDDLNHSQSGSTGRQSTPRSRTKSIYGTPSTLRKLAQLPSERLQGGGEVYQNPLRRDEEEEGEGEGGKSGDVDVDTDTDDLVARNTRMNAIASLPPAAGKRKKKKGGR